VEKIWLAQYQEGVPYEINPNEHSSLVEVFEQACQQYASNEAYVNLGTSISYQAFEEKTRQFASFLQGLGLNKGDRVALMMPNILQYPIALFGILRAGMVVVNTNPLYTADELIHQMNDSGAKAILVFAHVAHTVAKALPSTKLEHVIITEVGDAFPLVKRIFINALVKYVKRMIPSYSISGVLSYRKAMKSGRKLPFKPVTLTHQDIAFLQYTGGTTGVSKGAMLTHGNMVANLTQAYHWLLPIDIGEKDIIVTALPLYHIFSLTANCLTFFRVGAKNILITNPRNISQFIKTIKHAKFTAITGVNTLFNALLNHPKFSEIDFSALKLALSGGMALQKSVAIRWHQLTHTRLLEAYGLTETSPAAIMNPIYLETYNGSIGLPISSTDISLRDENGHEVGIGETGELCIKGPQVMPGYWQQKAETAMVFTPDGYLKTGDMAEIDEKGFVYLVDRKKDIIVVSGFNVYPNEIEQVIGMLPSVLEVGVVGVYSEHSGEVVKACIVKKDESLTAEEVINHCREHLTAYKVPKIVAFYQELPKTNVGKILRRALRNNAEENK
jgi:long-chain acyl-CoA synthetase